MSAAQSPSGMPAAAAPRPARRFARGLAAAVLVAAAAFPAWVRAQEHLVPRMEVPAPAGAKDLCRVLGWACARSTPSAGPAAPAAAVVDLARQVNLGVNRHVAPLSDESQYRRAEHWALPTARGGDCEDFALLKKRELMARGVAPERLLLATVLDLEQASHAVLILRTDAGDLVLDNLTDRIATWRETGYTFLRMQDPADPSRWTAVVAGGLADRAQQPVATIGG